VRLGSASRARRPRATLGAPYTPWRTSSTTALLRRCGACARGRLDELVAACHPDEAALLTANLERLAHTALVIAQSPPISASLPARGSRGAFSSESLVDLLCRVPDYDFDLHIPTKAVLGQAFLIAKINFFKALGYALDAVGAPATRSTPSSGSRSTPSSPKSCSSRSWRRRRVLAVKQAAAARALPDLEERLSVEIDDFAPFLESVWRARDRLRPVLGTMRGTTRCCAAAGLARRARARLLHRGRPARSAARLREFLFGLSHEEIERLRAHLLEQDRAVVSADDARRVLGRSEASWPHERPAGLLLELQAASRARRLSAAHRRPGPKKTAEEYMMGPFC